MKQHSCLLTKAVSHNHSPYNFASRFDSLPECPEGIRWNQNILGSQPVDENSGKDSNFLIFVFRFSRQIMFRAKSLFFLLSVSQFFFFSCGVIKESNQSLCQLIPKVRIGNEVKHCLLLHFGELLLYLQSSTNKFISTRKTFAQSKSNCCQGK